MRHYFYQFLLFLSIFLGVSIGQSLQADRVISAYKKLQKGDYEKTRELLNKELEKSPESAGAFHVLSLYFFAQNNPAYQLDSAYFMVQKALDLYPKGEEKDLEKWREEGLDSNSAQSHKAAIEAAAFTYAQSQNTLAAWAHFLEIYTEAKNYTEARTARDALAWRQTEGINTLEAYRQFIEDYPNASQAPEARRRRDRFIYEQATSAGTLSNYQQFLQNNPNNYYANEAQNKLFELATLEHTLQAYHDFVKQYPQGEAALKAYEWIAAFYAEKNDLKNYLNLYPNAPNAAHIQKLAELGNLQYLPFYEEELFGYIDELGTVRLPNNYEYIPREHLCESIEGNHITINLNGRLGLIDKTGMIILNPQYDVIDPLGAGLFRVTKNARQGLFFQSGRAILPLEYDAIEVLNTHFLKTRKNRRWGLSSFNGRNIVSPQFADIEALGEHFILFRNGSRYAIRSNQSLFEETKQAGEEINPQYDKIQLLGERYAILHKDSSQTLMDYRGKIVFENAAIIKPLSDWGFALNRDSTWQIYDNTGKSLSDSTFQDFVQGGDYLGLKIGGKWGLKDKTGKTLLAFIYNEMRFIGETLWLKKAREEELIFLQNPEKPKIDVTAFQNIRGERGSYPQAELFVYYEDRYGKKGLFAQSGTKILSPKYDNVYILDPQLINVQSYGKYGLVDTLQKLVLPIRYDGISNLEKGYKVLLQQGKFGLFHYDKNLNLRPEYSAAPSVLAEYDSTLLFIVEKQGKKGLIDGEGKDLLSPKYQEILPLSTNRVLLQDASDKWRIQALSKDVSPDTLAFEEAELLSLGRVEAFVKVSQDKKQGILKGGKLLIPCEYDLIHNLGNKERPVFFAEQRKPDKAQFMVTYFNADGKAIWQKMLSELEYYKLICEE